MNEKAIEIFNWLKEQGYSIPTVCEGSKISKTYYYNIIKNEKNISREVFDRIEEFAKSKGFGVSNKPIVNQKCNDEQVLKNANNIKAIYKMVKELQEENKKKDATIQQLQEEVKKLKWDNPRPKTKEVNFKEIIKRFGKNDVDIDEDLLEELN